LVCSQWDFPLSDGKWFAFRINYHQLPGKSTGMKAGNAGGCHFPKKQASEGESLFFSSYTWPCRNAFMLKQLIIKDIKI
jgi:hypothetical protein